MRSCLLVLLTVVLAVVVLMLHGGWLTFTPPTSWVGAVAPTP